MPATQMAEKGDRLACQICGLVVVVDTACGCVEEKHEIICCDAPMERACPNGQGQGETSSQGQGCNEGEEVAVAGRPRPP